MFSLIVLAVHLFYNMLLDITQYAFNETNNTLVQEQRNRKYPQETSAALN